MRMPLVCAVLCLLGASVAHAAPAAPQVTVGASNIKELQFDWAPVPQTNTYELWFKANAGASWVKYAETPAQRPRFRIGVSVHLLDWRVAKYRVKACNPSGCSTSNDVGVEGLALDAIGYFKPVANDGRRYFGGNVAVSADGKTIAAVTNEDSDAYQGNAAIYVYRKGSSGWYREARLLTSAPAWATAHIYAGEPLALSGDGNLLVFGSEAEDVPDATGQRNAGAVSVYRRNGSTWTLSQKLFGTNQEFDNFGYIVDVDDAGRTVAVLHRWNGNSFDFGNVEIFRDAAGGADHFAHSTSLPVPMEGSEPAFCGSIALSGDGKTLLRTCAGPGITFAQVLSGPGFGQVVRLEDGGTYDGSDLNYDGTVALLQDRLDAIVYRLGSSGWAQDGFITTYGEHNYSRRHIALSRDGKIAALGSWNDNKVGLGPIYPPYQTTAAASGGVAVYERRANGWSLRRIVKPGSVNEQWAGHAVALGDNGKVLVVGAPFDASAATGIDGDRDDASAAERGAVWIY